MPKYRIAVLGSTGRGNYGHGLDTAWSAIPQTEVVAVSDDNKIGLSAAAKKLKVERVFTDYRKLFDTVKPDIAAVCPRWVDQHRDMTLAAVERGIHVYMEKPFCRSPAEADEIVAASEKHKIKIAVAHPTRYSPTLETIKKLIADGAIGKVLEYRGRGKEDRRGGGEDLWVLGTHVMDMIRAIGGKPDWCYATLHQDGRPVTKADVVAGPEGIGPLAGNHVEAMYGMPDGSTAYFGSRQNKQGNPSRYALQIFGSKGIIELLEGILPSVKILQDASWSSGRSGKAWQTVSSAGIGKPEPLQGPEYSARHTLAIRDFLSAIEQDRQPLDGVYVARDVTEMITAAFASHMAGGRIDLPLKHRGNPLG
ncbi:MAG: Gfo/Idh/MocA family oxidoreductase [Planctomycetota bacterium]|nr:Gfo/Idh/MocA family oxidoreductase [Planctomycetota bacterium]